MTKSKLWRIYTDKNPAFVGDGQVTMTAAGLRKLFDQTYEQGFEQGKAVGAALGSIAKGVGNEPSGASFEDLFSKMFRP